MEEANDPCKESGMNYTAPRAFIVAGMVVSVAAGILHNGIARITVTIVIIVLMIRYGKCFRVCGAASGVFMNDLSGVTAC